MAWLLQDFTTFTEVDPESEVVVDSNIDFTNIYPGSQAVVYDEREVLASFKLRIHFKLTLCEVDDTGYRVGLVGVTNENNLTLQSMEDNSEGVALYLYSINYYGTNYVFLDFKDFKSGKEGVGTGAIFTGTDYYIEVERNVSEDMIYMRPCDSDWENTGGEISRSDMGLSSNNYNKLIAMCGAGEIIL